MKAHFLFLVAACGSGSTSQSAHFQSATLPQIDAALAAASGIDAIGRPFDFALGLVAQSPRPSCPTISGSGSQWTIAGGCVEGTGTTWSGQAMIANAPGFGSASASYDANKPTVVTFASFAATGGANSPITLDGQIQYTGMTVISSADAGFAWATAASDLTVTTSGLEATDQLQLTTVAGAMTPGNASTIDVATLGGATVSGSWDLSAPSGVLRVNGADEIVFDVSHRDSSGCVPYAIGAATGTACPP